VIVQGLQINKYKAGFEKAGRRADRDHDGKDQRLNTVWSVGRRD